MYENQKDIRKLDNEINELTSHRFFDKQYDKNPKKREAIEKKILTLINSKIMLEKINRCYNVKSRK